MPDEWVALDHARIVLSNQSRYYLFVLKFRTIVRRRLWCVFGRHIRSLAVPCFLFFCVLCFMFVFGVFFGLGCVRPGVVALYSCSVVSEYGHISWLQCRVPARCGGSPYWHDCTILGPCITMVSCHYLILVERIDS